jgi:hypothetical protein
MTPVTICRNDLPDLASDIIFALQVLQLPQGEFAEVIVMPNARTRGAKGQ